MSRKTKIVTVAFEGRDAGKRFKLEEMDPDTGERWALRALFAIANQGVDLPPGLNEAGMEGIAQAGFTALSKVPYETAGPLLDELMKCVKFVNAESGAETAILSGAGSQVEEVKTRLWLKFKVFELHTGFSLPALESTSA